VNDINAVLQAQLRRQHMDEVTAVEAARWLDAAGVLKDSDARPGLPLRNLLRAGRIDGAIQRPASPFGRWHITRTDRGIAGSTRSAAAARQRRDRKSPKDQDEQLIARRRRERAARKYRPSKVKLLLVAEAPPAALDRYFYFEEVPQQDSLFRYVARSVLKTEPSRTNKQSYLPASAMKEFFSST
jgi:hypothetical protein